MLFIRNELLLVAPDCFLTQVLANITASEFLNRTDVQEGFKKTVASLVDGVQSDNVIINNATDVELVNVNGTTFLFSEPPSDSLATNSAATRRALTAMEYQTHLRTRGLQEQNSFSGILIDYSVTFNAQDVLIVSTDAQTAYDMVSQRLQVAVSDGSFDNAMQATATRLNLTPLLKTQTIPSAFSIREAFTTLIVHSALPTSRPSSQPSSFPSAVPSLQPSSAPSAVPSIQPSSAPSSTPTSAPTFQVETTWMAFVAAVFEQELGTDKDGRSSYFDLRVEAQQLYGSCTEWNNYILRSLPASAAAKDLSSLSLVGQGGYVNASRRSVLCDEVGVVADIIGALSSPLSAPAAVHSAAGSLSVSYKCNGRTWVVQECRANRFESGDGMGFNTSKALCVDCTDPCSQYSCAEDPGLFVLSPCTAVASGKECAHLQGTMRIISTDVDDESGAGYLYILQWYCTLWGLIIVTITLYERVLMLKGWGAATARSDKLSFVRTERKMVVTSSPKVEIPRVPTSEPFLLSAGSASGKAVFFAAENQRSATPVDSTIRSLKFNHTYPLDEMQQSFAFSNEMARRDTGGYHAIQWLWFQHLHLSSHGLIIAKQCDLEEHQGLAASRTAHRIATQ